MSDVAHTPFCNVFATPRFISVEAYSGYRRYALDASIPARVLPNDAADECLGDAVIAALKTSRQIASNEFGTFFDRHRLQRDYEARLASLMNQFGIKTKRALLKDMSLCNVERSGDIITISPTTHEKPEGWSGDGISADDIGRLPSGCTSAELGAALRAALARCR